MYLNCYFEEEKIFFFRRITLSQYLESLEFIYVGLKFQYVTILHDHSETQFSMLFTVIVVVGGGGGVVVFFFSLFSSLLLE